MVLLCYYMHMEKLNEIISKNICEYRKMAKLTQNELAQKLNFSDKSVSKWERGDAIPDVSVLMQMCEIFGVTLNDMVGERVETPPVKMLNNKKKFVISLMSGGLVWLVATLVFVAFLIFADGLEKTWLTFVYAVPVSLIVYLVFACMWGKDWLVCLLASLLIWTGLVTICLTAEGNAWNLLYIGIPLQILTGWWFWYRNLKKQKVEK